MAVFSQRQVSGTIDSSLYCNDYNFPIITSISLKLEHINCFDVYLYCLLYPNTIIVNMLSHRLLTIGTKTTF